MSRSAAVGRLSATRTVVVVVSEAKGAPLATPPTRDAPSRHAAAAFPIEAARPAQMARVDGVERSLPFKRAEGARPTTESPIRDSETLGAGPASTRGRDSKGTPRVATFSTTFSSARCEPADRSPQRGSSDGSRRQCVRQTQQHQVRPLRIQRLFGRSCSSESSRRHAASSDAGVDPGRMDALRSRNRVSSSS